MDDNLLSYNNQNPPPASSSAAAASSLWLCLVSARPFCLCNNRKPQQNRERDSNQNFVTAGYLHEFDLILIAAAKIMVGTHHFGEQ